MNRISSREEALFSDALVQPPGERNAFLEMACGADVALLGRLVALVAAHEGADNILAGPTVQLSPVHEEKAGDLIGHYKLLQKLGEGGCGVVWMAEQEEPVRRRVALKVIKLGMDTKAVVARFEVERQALAMMDHPNIAKVHDAGSTESGRPFFVMELVRGIPITKYCDDNHLTPTERLDLFIKVCHAVQHAHQKGIIHRDLKPSNILVTVNDGAPTPKVIDFGIAKATQGRLTDATLCTAFEQFIGTPVYMSPEQAEMTSLDIDARSDIYSLGILLYELLTGQPPFDPKEFAQAGVDQIRRKIRDVEPPRPSRRFSTLGEIERTTVARLRSIPPVQLSSLLRGDLDWIVMRCLEKDRTRRYQTAHALATDVQRHIDHDPVIARPPSTAYRLRKFGRRHRISLVAAGISLATLLTGAILARWHTIRETEREKWEARNLGSTASLAVLAFTNLSSERESEFFSVGISEELLSILAKVPGLRVAAATSSAFSDRIKGATLQEIGAKLGVAYVVDGSVRRAGNSVRVTVRLSRAATSDQIWANVYSRELHDIFSVQNEIAQSIVGQVRAALLGGSAEVSDEIRMDVRVASRGRSQNTDAYALFLRGRFLQMKDSKSALQEAIKILEQAVAIDPSFALAWAELSNAYRILASNHGIPSLREGFRRARNAAERALQHEPDLVEAHSSMMLVHIHHDLDWSAAERDKAQVMTLAPNHVRMLNGAAMLAIAFGNTDEAHRLAQRAVTVEPLNPDARGYLVTALMFAGRLSEAENEARRLSELGVVSVVADYWWSATALLQGRVDDALRISSSMEAFAQLTFLALGEHIKGNWAESDAALERLIAEHGEFGAYQVATVYAFRGDRENAFVWLDRAFEGRDSGLPYLKLDPLFQNLRGDPRWSLFLRKLRLAD